MDDRQIISEENLPISEGSKTPVDENEVLTLWKKCKIFLATHWRGLVLVLTPIIFSFILAGNPVKKYQWCAYTLILMAIYWVCECLPLAVTAFLPIFIFPLADVMDTNTVCKCYMNDTILMYLGSIFLAYSIQQSGLHKRIALGTVRAVGYSHYKLLLAVCLVSMFISMWITNTAATVMVVPIVFALLHVFEDQDIMSIYDTTETGDKVASDMTTCYFCAITFSATIGGIGTLVGTATNLTFKGLFQKAFPDAPEYLSFPMFSAFTIPLMLSLEICLYFWLCFLYFGLLRPKSKQAKRSKLTPEAINAAKVTVAAQYKALGRITFWEISVIVLFSGAIILFFCRSPQIFTGWGDAIIAYFGLTASFVKDSAAAFLVTFLLLAAPYSLDIFRNCTAKYEEDLTKEPIRSVLDWRSMDVTMPWSFMFLLGGGFALSTAAKPEYTDLNGVIGEFLRKFENLPNSIIILLLIIISVFLTNFASNVALANVVVPIGMTMAKEIGYNSLWYDIAIGLSCSFCYCLPVGTPGNLVAQSACNMPTGKMIKAGSGISVLTVLLIWAFVMIYAPVIWPDITTVQPWQK